MSDLFAGRDEKFQRAIAAIDAANADDPFTCVVRGEVRPKELGHAELMCEWVSRLDPEADDWQLLAARAHHLRRWESPRSAEPEGRAGYLRWRTAARKRHAELVGQLLRDVGYSDDDVERVQRIVNKEGLGKGDLADIDGRAPVVQTHEDALCLVFLETQFNETAEKLGDEKTIDVLARTLVKMGPRGRQAALTLSFDPPRAALVQAALAKVADSTP